MDNTGNGITSINSKIIETIISEQTKFKGNVTTDKALRIDGYFEGQITTSDIVIVSECGVVKGDVKCRELQLAGKGSGTVVCSELCNITNTGSFDGELTTADLVTVKGSKLNCRVTINS